MSLTIYLSGNISPNPETFKWRMDFAAEMQRRIMAEAQYKILDPCHTQFNIKLKELADAGNRKKYMTYRNSSKRILPAKDFNMLSQSNVMVVNLELADPEKPPIGTTHELCWSRHVLRGVTVIAIVGKKPNVWATHPFQVECIHHTVVGVPQAVQTVIDFFVDPTHVRPDLSSFITKNRRGGFEVKLPYNYICSRCAKALGGKWEPGHVGTSSEGGCPYCGTTTSLTGVNDYIFGGRRAGQWD